MCKHCDNNEECKVRCPLCQKQIYCSEKCAQIDWPLHSVTCNTHMVSNPKSTVFVPYVYEDHLTDQEFKDLEEDHFLRQSHLVQYKDPSGYIDQRLIEGQARFRLGGIGITGEEKLPRGAEPSSRDEDKYTIVVYQSVPFADPNTATQIELTGSLKNDAIYRNNPNNKVAKQLAQFRSKGKENFVIWPSPAQVEQKTLETGMQFPTIGGDIAVTVYAGDRRDDDSNLAMYMTGVYHFAELSQRKLGRLRRKLLSILQRDLRKKREVLGKNEAEWSLQNVEVLRGTDDEGNRVQLTFMLPPARGGKLPQYATLLDVEVSVPVRAYRQAAARQAFAEGGGLGEKTPTDLVREKYVANARDIDMVTGMTAALEEEVAEIQALLKDPPSDFTQEDRRYAKSLVQDMRNKLSVIEPHRQSLEAHRLAGNAASTLKISNEVNSTMFAAAELMWKNIGNEARVKKFMDKIIRSGGQSAVARAQALAEKMEKLRSTTGKLKGRIARARKKLVRREINDLQTAIARASASGSLSDTVLAKLQEAMVILRDAEMSAT